MTVKSNGDENVVAADGIDFQRTRAIGTNRDAWGRTNVHLFREND